MSQQPSVAVGRCVNCGGYPILDAPFFKRRVRLTCGCGVSGAWVKPTPWDFNIWNAASRGWDVVSRPLSSIPKETMK